MQRNVSGQHGNPSRAQVESVVTNEASLSDKDRRAFETKALRALAQEIKDLEKTQWENEAPRHDTNYLRSLDKQ
ncbi:unnamed protein product [Pedinophyceae sp. YPF-701]|nr:unnamed protein product [Pedinophyceae sp. YPF-701]